MVWGAIAGAALSTVGSIIGGVSAANARRRQRQYIKEQKQKNENWYNRRFNEDETQRADAQRLLTMAEESVKNRNKASAGTQAVMGGTEESVAADKAANAKTISDATAQIAANAASRKDSIEQQYRQADQGYDAQLAGVEAQKASDIAGATQGVLQAGASIAQSIDSAAEQKKMLQMQQQNYADYLKTMRAVNGMS